MNTDALRSALHRDAELAPRPARDLLDQVAQRRRRSTRRRISTAAGGLALATVIAASPLVATSFTGDDRASVAEPAQVDLLNSPTRGSLAGDTELLESFRQLSWRDPSDPEDRSAQPDLDTRNVVFAGDIGDTRVASVAGTIDGNTFITWFTGTAGAPADRLQEVGSSRAGVAASPRATIDLDVPNPIAIVRGAPGDEIEFSPAAQLNRDGTITRTYQAGTDIADGITIWPTTSTAAPALAFRISRDNIVTTQSRPDINGDAGRAAGDTTVPSYVDPRGYAPAADGRFITTMVDEVTTNLQLTTDQLVPTLLWAGPVPGPDTTRNTAVVLGYTAPNGATLIQETAFAEDSTGGYLVVPGALQPFPAGTAVGDHPLLVRNVVGDGTADQVVVTSLLAVGPATATQARLTPTDGTEALPTQLTGGAATLDDQDAASVDFLDDAGAVLATAPLSPAYRYGVGGSWPQ